MESTVQDTNNNQIKKPHTFTLENRTRGTVTGVEKVISSNDTTINLQTVDGGIQLLGKDFKIKRFSQDEGIITFEGEVESLKYTQVKTAPKNVLKRMFK